MFQDTLNKQIIRTQWDRPILQKLLHAKSDGLCYFGMPGPEIKDLLDWNDLLSYKTAVQIVRSGNQKTKDLETISRMHTNIAVKNISNVQVLRGSIEEIILKGHDIDDNPPRHSFREPSGKLAFRYDLMNLDFEGGAGYKIKETANPDSSGGQRIEAVRKMLDRQQGHSFLFFWTVNVRDTLGDEPLQYLKEVAQRVQNPGVRKVVDWTVGLNSAGFKHYQLKTWIPLFVKDEAEARRFYCHCYPPVVYEGFEHAKMVHFAFSLTYEKSRELRVASPQNEEEVARLPLVESIGSKLRIPSLQCPIFDIKSCAGEFEFLKKSTRERILSTWTGPTASKI